MKAAPLFSVRLSSTCAQEGHIIIIIIIIIHIIIIITIIIIIITIVMLIIIIINITIHIKHTVITKCVLSRAGKTGSASMTRSGMHSSVAAPISQLPC